MAAAEQRAFGVVLKRLRLAAGLTQEALAERSGLSSKAVSGLERDPTRTPRLETITLLADALDLDRAERADLLAAARPESASPATLPRPPAQVLRQRLPRPLTPLIGRTQDVERVAGHLQQDDRQLVTLVGPGGVGKTRLAIAVGQRLASIVTDGVVFVDLAPVRDAGLVLPTVALSLGVAEARDRPLQDVLTDYLRTRHLLLVLDNVEQVSAAGQDLLLLLEGCVHLQALVTSREPLHVRGEQVYPVAPLALPHDALALPVAARSPAVALFLDRASASGIDLPLDTTTIAAVVEICRQLDGLPLAIELAAAWVRIFPPQALLPRLRGPAGRAPSGSPLQFLSAAVRDVPSRHQTLHDAIDWSYQLLSPAEQRLFARLAVFAGGWTLQAAEAVCAVPRESGVLPEMAALVDKSLVTRDTRPAGEARFGMLETIREYAHAQLTALDEEAQGVRRRHADYVLASAREAAVHYWGRERALWLQRLTDEFANLRAALAWARDTGEVEIALQLGGALFWFWQEGGYWIEARDWLESTLAVATVAHRTVGRAAALNAAAICNWSLGNVVRARAQAEQSLSIARELGDRRAMGHALHGLGVLTAEQGDLAAARALIEEGLALSRAVGDRPFVGLALHNLGLFAVRENDEETARARIEESRQVWQELGSTPFLSLVANSLGDLARSRGRFAEAATHYRESLELLGPAGLAGWRAATLHNLGHATHRLGDARAARDLFAEALVLCRELGDRRGVAECVAGLACALAATQPERTGRLLGAAMASIDAAGPHLSRSSAGDYAHAQGIARRQLGDAAYDEAWRQGWALSLEQAAALALEDTDAVRDEQ